VEVVEAGAQEEEHEESFNGVDAALDAEEREDGEEEVVEQLQVSKLEDRVSRPTTEEPTITAAQEEEPFEQPLQALPRLQVPVDLEDEWEDDDGSKEIKISRWDQTKTASTREAEVPKPLQSAGQNFGPKEEQQHVNGHGSQGRRGRGNRWAPVLPMQPGVSPAEPEVAEPQAVVKAAPTLELQAGADSQEAAEAPAQAAESEAPATEELLADEAEDTQIAAPRRRPVAMKRPQEAARITWRPTLRHMQSAESSRTAGR